MPLSSATQAGSQVATGTYAARTGVSGLSWAANPPGSSQQSAAVAATKPVQRALRLFVIKASSHYCFHRGDTLANRPLSEKHDRERSHPAPARSKARRQFSS
jgi:hypothetical protein